MESAGRCRCGECRSTEMVLLELDVIAPVMIARERELLKAIVE